MFSSKMEVQSLIQDYSDETSCMMFFRDLRQKHGLVCTGCGGEDYAWLMEESQFQCRNCGNLTALKSGTVMENSGLSYRIWFALMYFIQRSSHDVSSADLRRLVGQQRYATAWVTMHKLQNLMSQSGEYIEVHDIADVEANIIELFRAYEELNA